MTFDDALTTLMNKSYYSLNNFAISMKDAEEIILIYVMLMKMGV